MNKQLVIDILKSLAKKRPVFTSEADFQFSLAWEIQNAIPDSKVLLEYPVVQGDKTIYIDIVVVIDEKKHPIELKYKTKELKNISIYDTTVNLKNHAAQDLGRYAYLKDIERIEELKTDRGFSTGYAIMITNDNSYLENVRNTAKCLDHNFRINRDKVINGKLPWNYTGNNFKHWTTNYLPIHIKGTYKMNWNLYSTHNNKDNFHLLICEI